jgi:Mg2+ and Co2+ transporter CorA
VVIWTYTLTKSNRLQARDAHSSDELQKLSEKVSWLWIDCLEPSDEELEIIAELLEETKVINAIKNRQVFSRYERINDYLLLSIPLVTFKDKLGTSPIYVFAKEKRFISVRGKASSKSIDNTLKTFQDCILRVECSVFSPFIISRLFHEVTNENLDGIMALRERIDGIEERALAKPGDKRISKVVFALKREISALERVLWVQRGMMLDIREGVVPAVESSEMDRQTLSYAINDISRELSLIDSYGNALDSILRLQDLGMIHRVERTLIYLTLVTVSMNIIMILLEMNIFEILSG